MSDVNAVHQAAAACYDRMALQHAKDHASSETPFRHFNNFVKKALIQTALDNARANNVSNAAVLDLASGRGGDLMKWCFGQSPKLSKATAKLTRKELTKASEYYCYDISPQSIQGAQQRAEESLSDAQAKDMRCTFEVANCFDESFLQETLSKHPKFGGFDIITVQFAFHYACSNEERVRMVLRYCFGALAPGGLFVATMVNSEKVRAAVDFATGVVKGGKFEIEFRPAAQSEEMTEPRPAFNAQSLHLGAQYRFLLEGFVDCDEFFVPIEDLRRVASEVGFEEDAGKPFDTYISAYRIDPKSLALSADDRELTSLYRTVLLRKPGGSVAVTTAEPDAGSRFAAFRR
jgi:mRNA (guanine-N7-)-methyltransferase